MSVINGRFSVVKKIILYLWSLVVTIVVAVSGFLTAEGLDVDDFVIFILPITVGALILLSIVLFLFLGRQKLEIVLHHEDGKDDSYIIKGKGVWGKSFYLPFCEVEAVKTNAFKSISFLKGFGRKETVFFLDNRKSILLRLKEIGADVADVDEGVVISGVEAVKKKRLLKILTRVSLLLTNVLFIASWIWLESPGNYHKHWYTDYWYYYGYKIPYEDYYWDYDYEYFELFTTYAAIFFAVAFLVLVISYLIMSNNKIEVRGSDIIYENSFGKIKTMPVSSVTGITIRKWDSSVTIKNVSGKICCYMILNNLEFAQAVEEIRKNGTVNTNTQVAAAEPVVEKKSSGSMQDLVKLKELLDMGILTQEEFDVKKKEILGL